LWQKLVKAKYLSKSSIHNVNHKLNDSPIWYDLLKIKDVYLKGRAINIENGECTRFWEDGVKELDNFQIKSMIKSRT
jgi:hypothetical protein